MANATIDESGLWKHITLEVTVKRSKEYRFRKWVALNLINLAGWILDFNIEVNAENQEDLT